MAAFRLAPPIGGRLAIGTQMMSPWWQIIICISNWLLLWGQFRAPFGHYFCANRRSLYVAVITTALTESWQQLLFPWKRRLSFGGRCRSIISQRLCGKRVRKKSIKKSQYMVVLNVVSVVDNLLSVERCCQKGIGFVWNLWWISMSTDMRTSSGDESSRFSNSWMFLLACDVVRPMGDLGERLYSQYIASFCDLWVVCFFANRRSTIASRAVIVIVPRSDRRTGFWSQLNHSKTVKQESPPIDGAVRNATTHIRATVVIDR